MAKAPQRAAYPPGAGRPRSGAPQGAADPAAHGRSRSAASQGAADPAAHGRSRPATSQRAGGPPPETSSGGFGGQVRCSFCGRFFEIASVIRMGAEGLKYACTDCADKLERTAPRGKK